MKRFFCFVATLILLTVTCTICTAEEETNPILEKGEVRYLNSRNLYGIRDASDTSKQDSVMFGQELNIIENQGEYCIVEYTELMYDHDESYNLIVAENKKRGIFRTSAIVETPYPLIFIDDVGCDLSYKPGLKRKDFGFASGGHSRNTIAIILFETDDGYIYIVTKDGYSGYVKSTNTHISVFDKQLICNE